MDLRFGGAALGVVVAMGVGAGFRLEGGGEIHHLGAQPDKHGLQYVVGLDAQPAGTHLHCHVAVAQVIGDPRQRLGVGTTRFEQVFRRRDDLDNAPVLRQQAIAAAQDGAARQEQANLLAIGQLRAQAALGAGVEVELQAGSGSGLAGVEGFDEKKDSVSFGGKQGKRTTPAKSGKAHERAKYQ